MIENAYIVSLLALSVALFAMGLLCLFLRVYDDPKLNAYRRASKAVAVTYLFFGVINILECLERQSGETSDNALLFRMVTLVIASAQAFFFMYAMVSLVNTKYMTARRTRREFTPVLVFTVAGIVSYIILDETITGLFAYVYTAFYFSQLIRYTLIFRKLYRHCIADMENWFSENEEDRLRWIFYSFHSALAIGLVAFVFAIFPYAIFGLITSLACLVFYVFFAIRFVNYVFVFNKLEDVIAEEPEEEEYGDNSTLVYVTQYADTLKNQINKWIATKQFCQEGLTIRDLADYLRTNTAYLSYYINNCEGKTFREWIGVLRIEEAKRLMKQNPSRSIESIAEAIGYNNKSSFHIQFVKQTNITPGEWRRIF